VRTEAKPTLLEPVRSRFSASGWSTRRATDPTDVAAARLLGFRLVLFATGRADQDRLVGLEETLTAQPGGRHGSGQ
jgi:hypothetical protein